MSQGITEVPTTGLIVAALVLVVAAAGVQVLAKGQGARTIWAGVRMSAQLIAMGFILTWLFANPHPLVTLGILALMLCFGVLTVYGQHKGTLTPHLRWVIAVGVIGGSAVALAVFLGGIVQVDPIWDPRYVVPTAGMIIGNTMTGVNLTVRGLDQGMRQRRTEIDQALYLGATPARATQDIRTAAFGAAITPTTTSMLSMGIVILPGMMTGQILSGVDPLIAVVYQAVIMVGILLSVVLACAIVLGWGMSGYFDSHSRLVASFDHPGPASPAEPGR